MAKSLGPPPGGGKNATFPEQLRCGYEVTDLFRQLRLLRFQLLLTLYLGVLDQRGGPQNDGAGWKAGNGTL